MQLRRPLPPDRTLEQVWNHYLAEKAIAAKLKSSDREGRRALYATMYAELFSKVPDHPRLTRRRSEALTRAANQAKHRLVDPFLSSSAVFVEFGSGDCRFAAEIAGRVREAIGIDISDQSGQLEQRPDNFRLVVYDGFHLDLENCANVVFSDQVVEHFHPEDTGLHFEIVWRTLRPGGRYVFRTPHAFTGPHDISRYFSDEPEGFHLKEWTYSELGALLKETQYSRLEALIRVKGRYFRVPLSGLVALEQFASALPQPYKRAFSQRVIRELAMVVTK